MSFNEEFNHLSVRTKNILEDLGVSSWRELSLRTESDIRSARNCGKASFQEITDGMKSRGLMFATKAEQNLININSHNADISQLAFLKRENQVLASELSAWKQFAKLLLDKIPQEKA